MTITLWKLAFNKCVPILLVHVHFLEFASVFPEKSMFSLHNFIMKVAVRAGHTHSHGSHTGNRVLLIRTLQSMS